MSCDSTICWFWLLKFEGNLLRCYQARLRALCWWYFICKIVCIYAFSLMHDCFDFMLCTWCGIYFVFFYTDSSCSNALKNCLTRFLYMGLWYWLFASFLRASFYLICCLSIFHHYTCCDACMWKDMLHMWMHRDIYLYAKGSYCPLLASLCAFGSIYVCICHLSCTYMCDCRDFGSILLWAWTLLASVVVGLDLWI